MEIWILKRFLPLKIQINSKKPGFGRKNQLKNMVTLGPPAHATLVMTKTFDCVSKTTKDCVSKTFSLPW